MFLFFKPPQSILQFQITDPSGERKRYNAIEEAYAAQILKERQAKVKKRKRPLLEFKKQIEAKLDLGISEQEIVQEVDTDKLRLEVSAIVAEYQAKLAAEIEARIEAARQLELARLEEERRLELVRQKKRKQKERRLKVLLLLAAMDDE